jgi:hypothetical protein
MNTEVEFKKDLFTVLQFATRHMQLTDAAAAALSRLSAAATTDKDRSAQRLADLKARRSNLIQASGELAHNRQRLNFIAAQAGADATAKQQADQATAAVEANRKALAEVEAAIAEMGKEAA